MHCLAQGLSGKLLNIRKWLQAGFPHTRTSMFSKDKPTQPICPTPQPAEFPSDLLRPSPNYRSTSGFPVSLIFRTLFLKKKKRKEKQKTNKKAYTFLHIMPQWKENRPSIFRPQFALFFFKLHHHII